MRLATKKDRDVIVNILFKAYKDNPSFKWIIKPGTEEEYNARLKHLCGYCFDVIEPIGGVYITSYEQGVAMIYNINDRKKTLKSWMLDIELAFKVIGVTRGLEIMQREKRIAELRADGDYLYFWMLAADPDVKGFHNMAEIRDETYAMSEKLNLPIYAETTVDRNVIMYRRYGFEVYDKWEVPGKDVNVHFLWRKPGAEKKQLQNQKK